MSVKNLPNNRYLIEFNSNYQYLKRRFCSINLSCSTKTSSDSTNIPKSDFSIFEPTRFFDEDAQEVFVCWRIMFKFPSGTAVRDAFLSINPYLLFTLNIARDTYGMSESIHLPTGLVTYNQAKWFIDVWDLLSIFYESESSLNRDFYQKATQV